MWTLTRDLLIALAGILMFIGVVDANDDQWIHDTNLGVCYTQKALNEREQSAYQMGVRNGQAIAQGKFVKQLGELCKAEGVIEIFDGYLLLCAPKEKFNGNN